MALWRPAFGTPEIDHPRFPHQRVELFCIPHRCEGGMPHLIKDCSADEAHCDLTLESIERAFRRSGVDIHKVPGTGQRGQRVCRNLRWKRANTAAALRGRSGSRIISSSALAASGYLPSDPYTMATIRARTSGEADLASASAPEWSPFTHRPTAAKVISLGSSGSTAWPFSRRASVSRV